MCVDLPLAVHGDEGCWREIIEHVYQVDGRITDVTRIGTARTTLRIRYSGRVVPTPVLDAITAVSTAISTSHERVPVEVIFSHRDGEPGRQQDALRELVERGAVRLTRDGRLEASGLFLRVMGGLKQELRRYATGLGAEEYEFPSLLPIDVAQRCGIFDNQPHHVHFVSTLKSMVGGGRGSPAAITKAGAHGESRNQLARPHMILSPAVCYHYWSGGRPGSGGGRSIDLGMATGRCYRFEAPGLVGLERLREFTMWEIFAAGEPDGTRALRLRCLDYIKDLMVRLDLAGRVATASDSFFADVHARKRMFQVNMQLKHELQLWLPHKGEGIAAASVNDHRDFFTRAFGIAPDGGATVHSFCMAVGLERLTLAVLSQHGLEPAHWPPALASLVRSQ